MSTQIDVQNRKQIRDKMEVYCSLSAKDRNASLTITSVNGAEIKDDNYKDALQNEHWSMRKISDFKGEGFLLDGSCELYGTSGEASEETGKIGIRSKTGGQVSFQIDSSREISALTVAITGGTGIVTTSSGDEYEAQRITIIPVNTTSITFTVKSDDQEERIEVASITPGISLKLTDENITNVTAALRSDTSISDASWQISEIEIKAYWPDDISEAISNIGDDVPITYYAGYKGNYSRTRTFYLSEAAKMEGNIITIKGQDASEKLDGKKLKAVCDRTYRKNAKRALYGMFLAAITASKIKLKKKEGYPAVSGTSKTVDTLIYTEQYARERVAHFMNVCHNSTAGFWPTFVDAGYPHVYWSKPDTSLSTINRGYGIWEINEEDCGDVVREVDRNIAKISSSDDKYGMRNTCSRANKKKTFETKDVTKGKTYTVTFDGYVDDATISVSNATIISKSASQVYFKAKETTVKKKVKTKYKKKVNGKYRTYTKTVTKKINQCIVKAKQITIDEGASTIIDSDKRPGVTMETGIPVIGMQNYYRDGGVGGLFPNYTTLFSKSNIKGSFVWKGDPRMQPRDLFYFKRLDGTKEVCTIESIMLSHEGGGTKAEITYRKGVC